MGIAKEQLQFNKTMKNPIIPQIGPIGWPAFGKLVNLREELERLFEFPLTQLAAQSHLFNGAPALELSEDKTSFYAKLEVPGTRKEDISIIVEDGVLQVSGERKFDDTINKSDVFRVERFAGKFQRSIELPEEVATDKIIAQYTDGILTITLPKAEVKQPVQTKININ